MKIRKEQKLCQFLERELNEHAPGMLATIIDKAMIEFPAARPEDIARTLVHAFRQAPTDLIDFVRHRSAMMK